MSQNSRESEGLIGKSHGPPNVNDKLVEEAYRDLSRARSVRREFFNEDFFHEPAWDILFELFGSYLEQRRIAVSDLARRARLPQATALRWIRILETEGLILRRKDPYDGRRIFVEMTPASSRAMRRYLETLAR